MRIGLRPNDSHFVFLPMLVLLLNVIVAIVVINGDADVITVAVTATTAVVSKETANAVLAVVSIVAANDVVTFIF